MAHARTARTGLSPRARPLSCGIAPPAFISIYTQPNRKIQELTPSQIHPAGTLYQQLTPLFSRLWDGCGSLPNPARTVSVHRVAVPAASAHLRSRQKHANPGARWRTRDSCASLVLGYPCDKPGANATADTLRYRAGFPDGSTARRPWRRSDRMHSASVMPEASETSLRHAPILSDPNR